MMRKIALLWPARLSGPALWHGRARSQIAARARARAAASADTYRQLNLFGDVFERIRADYVEEPDDAKLIESAINGMLSSLDPHSSYLNAKDYQDMQVQTRGEFFGLGIEVTMENELIKVISPIDDTPAVKAGILAGDIITQLDGEQVQGLTLREAVEKMRGAGQFLDHAHRPARGRGRAAEDHRRARRDPRPVGEARECKTDIGYIRIASFSEQTMEGLEKAIDKIVKEVGGTS